MKKLYSVTNFSQGINEYSPQGASSIKDFNITNDGVLETRRGWAVNNTFNLTTLADDSLPMQTFFANQKLFMQTEKGLYYCLFSPTINTWAAVTNLTGQSGVTYTNFFDERLKVVVADNNRVFLASTNANLWLDSSESTPTLYNWGVSAVQLSVALTATSTSFGGILGTHGTANGMNITMAESGYGELLPGWYAFAMAYELKHGGTSPLSRRVLFELESPNNLFNLVLPNVGGTTPDWTGATYSTTLDGLINDSQTTVVVDSVFKMLIGMNITIGSEVMTITGGHTGAGSTILTGGTGERTLTVIREQAGTDAASHSDEAVVTFNLLDQQVTGIKVYATDKVRSDDEDVDQQELAKSAPLKYIKTIETSAASASSSYIYYQALGLKTLAGQLEGASPPPEGLTNITLYGGRMWGSVGSTDTLVFSALDETAAPLYDLFPSDQMSESSRTYAMVPHVVKARDRITGIGASRDYLAVFSENSIQLVRGQGVISGIYGIQQPGTDLDMSQYLTLMGAKDDWCVAESLGNVYFYSSHDQRIYRIDRDGNVAWISQAIQGLLGGDGTGESAGFLGGDPIDEGFIKQLVAHEGSIYIVRRDGGHIILYQFDELRDQWTSHDFGSSANMTSFVSNPHQKSGQLAMGLYALRDNDNDQIVKIFPYSGTGETKDNGSTISPSYLSQEFAFTKPTRLDAVRVGTESDELVSVTLNVELDGVLQSPIVNRTLSKNNNFTIRTFQRGYKYKVGFTLSGEQTVRFFELQFRGR